MLLVGRGNGASSMLGVVGVICDSRAGSLGQGRRGYGSGSDDRMGYK